MPKRDVLLELLVGSGEKSSFKLVLRRGRERLFGPYWLPSLEAGGSDVQVCPLYGACEPGEGARERALGQEAEFKCAVEESADRVCHVRTRPELEDPRLGRCSGWRASSRSRAIPARSRSGGNAGCGWRVAVMGIEHVGLGADFIEVARTEQGSRADDVSSAMMVADIKGRLWLDGLHCVRRLPALVAALRGRGY